MTLRIMTFCINETQHDNTAIMLSVIMLGVTFALL
jgi:hypothetical protein